MNLIKSILFLFKNSLIFNEFQPEDKNTLN